MKKKKVRENNMKTFYLNFTPPPKKKIIQTSVYAGLLFDNYLFNLEKADLFLNILAASIMETTV